MGFLGFISKRKAKTGLTRLPTGSFTVDRESRILVSTLPQNFPMARVEQIGRAVVTAFRQAAEAQIPLQTITFQYAALKITARELRGGAIVFLHPLSFGQTSQK
ncbi:MAG TPA: hypothetical protein P5186_21535 [Candidatus Paceibacterota bacterium]|nr:hypothetical protein [Verrucomicrobiota bacterium]HRY50642.1 hypothetical protein [Candidatus Paceibacterota bacterium]HSA00762.1 hypothetical protein [Candidatus Paceibacterota bacterium]